MTSTPVRWGILGPGNIAMSFHAAATGAQTGKVVAVGTRNSQRPELAENFPGCRVHGGYDALLADAEVDAIYIATPHAFHAEWTIKAAQRGKHVLCEKPMGMSAGEVRKMFAASTRAGTFLGEAFMYRLHPLTAYIIDFVRAGRLGEVRLITSSFGFSAQDAGPGHRLFAKELGGGAILDVGTYPMSIARLIAGCRTSDGFIEPAAIKGIAQFGETGVDVLSSCLVEFPTGVLADLSCSLSVCLDNVLRIIGTKARLEVDDFWLGTGRAGGGVSLRFYPNAGDPEIIRFEQPGNLYSFQFEAANRAIQSGAKRFQYPGMTEADSIGNAAALDQWIGEVTPS